MKGIIATTMLLTTLFGLGNRVLAQDTGEPPTADISALESGTYFAQGTMYSRSYRVVARAGDRLCVKIANGPPNPYEGSQEITISTVAQRDGQTVVTATGDEFMVRGAKEFVIGNGRLGVWQLASNFDRDFSAGLQACLDGQGDYQKNLRGPFITGMIYPNVPGQLVAKDAKARINVRKEPGEKTEIRHYGVVGDKVKMLYSSRDRADRIWYQVKFEGSGAEGWVRGDFVKRLK